MHLNQQGSSPKMEVANWPIDRLVPYARNARTHSAEQVAQLAASIETFGFNNPILVDLGGDIIAGHGRVLAARKLALDQVPVIVLSHLNEDQKRAFRLADNQLALSSGWDLEKLKLELEALAKQSFDLDLLGFDEDQLRAVLARETPSGADPDAVPELQQQSVSRADDVWMLGRHRLLCADGTKRESLARVLAGATCSLVFTDPPFNVDYTGKGFSKMKIANDNLGDQFGAFLKAACEAMLSVAQGAVYVCMSTSELHQLHVAFADAGGHWSTYIQWVKNNFTLGRSDYQRQFESILYGWPQGVKHYWCGDRDQSDVWYIDRPFRNDLHPTMKPVELVARAIRNSTKPGDVVLDPFAGSGSTMLACENLDRQARLVEIDPQYADVSVRRWQNYTGKKAYIESENKTFEEVAAARSASSSDCVAQNG